MPTTDSYIDIILPVPINQQFTYKVHSSLVQDIAIGKRVLVRFGKQGIQTGIITKNHTHDSITSPEYLIKDIIDIIDVKPILTPKQLKLIMWMREYYLSNLGDVLKTVLPSGLRLSSDSSIQLNPHIHSFEALDLSDEAHKVIAYLKKKHVLSYKDIPVLFSNKTDEKKNTRKYAALIKDLVIRDIVLPFDHLREKYTPKLERRFRLASQLTQPESLNAIIEALDKWTKQQEILLLYLQQRKHKAFVKHNTAGVPTRLVKENKLSTSAYNTLKKKEIIEEFVEVMPRIAYMKTAIQSIPPLTEEQQFVYKDIEQYFASKGNILLLHGKTGTGKTLLYMKMIQQVIAEDKQVLLLMPEIALTTHMIERLSAYFGKNMAIYHSKYSDNERIEIWRGVLEGGIKFVLGVRSAVFLPFQNLALIIMDESHEGSYKQYHKMPFYHAQTVCETLSHLHHCNLLLGTGTPDISTYHRAQKGEIGYAEMTYRFGKGQRPRFLWDNLKKAKFSNTLNGTFTVDTLEKIKTTWKQGYQILIFKNRRGYAPEIQCETCQSKPICPRCDISLTYHLHANELRCHYCGHAEAPQITCKFCGNTNLKTVGYGTEKIVEDLQTYLPGIRILRLDSDTTKSKFSYDKIISGFSRQEADILVGTQMISKGLDFAHVRLVVVPDSDNMLHRADFRAFEKTFQMLSQVGGRAGRNDALGEVVIQTYLPEHPVYQWITDDNYIDLYENDIKERNLFNYPPFCKLIKLELKCKKEQELDKTTTLLFQILLNGLGSEKVLGPVKPAVSKINFWFLRHIIVKIDGTLPKAKTLTIKRKIVESCHTALEKSTYRNIRININVDPF